MQIFVSLSARFFSAYPPSFFAGEGKKNKKTQEIMKKEAETDYENKTGREIKSGGGGCTWVQL